MKDEVEAERKGHEGRPLEESREAPGPTEALADEIMDEASGLQVMTPENDLGLTDEPMEVDEQGDEPSHVQGVDQSEVLQGSEARPESSTKAATSRGSRG
eukprot:scaffold32955_cov34-Prasinocladus_malaysianus.AAC.1